MRDKNLTSPIQFSQDVRDFILRRIPSNILDLRARIVDNPNFLEAFENGLRLKSRESEELLAITFLSWYLPETIGFLLRFELENYMKLFNDKDKLLFRIFSSSREESLIFLFHTKRWHSRDFYGNFLRKGLEGLEAIRPRLRTKRTIKKANRKRGYNDHGSRRPDTKWLPSYDWSFTEAQNEKERKETYQDKVYHRILRILRELLEIENRLNSP
jgi:hypothetical protein